MSGCRLRLYGRVQGVFFRNWTAALANELAVRGWVRNLRDGSVEILAWGEVEAVKALAAACRTGSRAAVVERIEVAPAAGEGPHSGFRVAPTE